MQAIILAGGLGTRLRSVVNDLPKCMAPVAGKPFLHYVIQQLLKQGVQQFIFSLGYMSEHITGYLQAHYPQLNYQVSIETEPLGTGGAILMASHLAKENDVLVLNGDTLFTVQLSALYQLHQQQQATCTLALKPMQNFNRYGVVQINQQQTITSFKEKQWYQQGLINGGVYLVNITALQQAALPQKFSFEKDYLEVQVNTGKLYGLVQDEYFIDIGIPEDFNRAQQELASLG
jgi:D-glycero-alpha-D-manno-heptose 1-phosphate guanylyltransferase